MGFLTFIFGGDDGLTIWSFGLALIIVLLLIVAAVWLLKVLFNATSQVGKNRDKRLSVIDTISVDSKRNLILIRRDDVEHLVLVGGGQDIAVETGIPASDTPRPSSAQRNLDRATQSPRQKTAAAASRLGLTGLLRRYNTNADSASSAPSQNAALSKAQKSAAGGATTLRPQTSKPTSANAGPTHEATMPRPSSDAQSLAPKNIGPLERLKALGMRKDEELPKPLRHTGLLVPKPQNDQESVDELSPSQNPATEPTDSANMTSQTGDLDPNSSAEQGSDVNNVDNDANLQSDQDGPRAVKDV